MTKWPIFIVIISVLALCSPETLRSQENILPEEPVIWQSDEIIVKPSEPLTSVSTALKALEGIENLVINEFQGGAVLGGKLLSPEDMRRVVLLSSSMESILNLCSFHPDALIVAASFLKRSLNENRINGLHLSPLGSALLLTGTPAEEGDVAKIQRMCDSLLIPLIDGTRSAIADPRMVLF